jgi:hypothetical protein
VTTIIDLINRVEAMTHKHVEDLRAAIAAGEKVLAELEAFVAPAQDAEMVLAASDLFPTHWSIPPESSGLVLLDPEGNRVRWLAGFSPDDEVMVRRTEWPVDGVNLSPEVQHETETEASIAEHDRQLDADPMVNP